MNLDEGRKRTPRTPHWLLRLIGTASIVVVALTIPAGLGALAATAWLLFRTGWRLVFRAEAFLP